MKNLIGLKFGRLTVLSKGLVVDRRVTWNCRCECGNEKVVPTCRLTIGVTKSCGCLTKDHLKQFITHGKSKTKEFKAWSAIHDRCLNKNDKKYSLYGGRGIKICDRWLTSFESFLDDMGPAPTPKHTVDRTNVNGDYKPDNCRWATVTEQNRNRRNTLFVTIRGVSKPLAEWCEHFSVPYRSAQRKFNRGTSIEKIFPFTAKILTESLLHPTQQSQPLTTDSSS